MEELNTVNLMFHEDGDANDVIAQIGPETVNRVSLRSLKPKIWLKDEIINSQMSMLNLKHLHSLESYLFASYFISKLLDEDKVYNFQKVKRWFKNVNIFMCKKLFFPINFDNYHWIFVCVYFVEKCIRFHDSSKKYLLNKDEERHVEGVFRCIEDEWIERHNREPKDWMLIKHRADTPLQPNSK